MKAVIVAIMMLGNIISQPLVIQAAEHTDDMKEGSAIIEEITDSMSLSSEETTDLTKVNAEEAEIPSEVIPKEFTATDTMEPDLEGPVDLTVAGSEKLEESAEAGLETPEDLGEPALEELEDSAEEASEEDRNLTGPDSEKEETLTDEQESLVADTKDEQVPDQIALDENIQDDTEMQWDVEEISLTLQYDDRYSLSELQEGYAIAYLENTEVTSYQVSGGRRSEEKDIAVITIGEGQDLELIATGTGSAMLFLVPEEQVEKALLDRPWEIGDFEDFRIREESETESEPIRVLKVNITVKPARLSLMYVAGQSNAEGQCSANTGYEINHSIACEPGSVYSTYAPGSPVSKKIADMDFSYNCNVENASDFVPGNLTDNKSISGKSLEYALDTLTRKGRGKTGIDSSLAYEWNRLTGDKVWVVNTAWGGSTIRTWIPEGSNYIRSAAVYDLVQQTYGAEMEAGHYVRGNQMLFWLQGEYDASRTAEYYIEKFHAMYNGLMDNYDLDAIGLIMVRSSVGSYKDLDEWRMTGPRIVQYMEGSGNGLAHVFVVSNVNEQWVSDQGVESYFSDAYPDGKFSYPMQGSDISMGLPTTVEEVHDDIHYSQTGHNENGITAAYGMYKVLWQDGDAESVSVSWKDKQGKELSGLVLHAGETHILVPVATPAYCGKKVSYFVEGEAALFDVVTGQLTGMEAGFANVFACLEDGNILETLPVTVYDALDLTSLTGESYTGLYYYNHTWHYLKNGWIQPFYSGIVRYGNSWWYVENGRVDFNYTGVAKNENGWWRIENGKVNFNYNGIAQNENGWWYIRNGKVNFDYTGVAKNENGWWRIEKGKVNFNYTGVAKNENGWWRIEKGKVNFNYTGVAKNENGWWRIEKGKVNFNYNGIAQNENGWWYIRNGKVDFSYTGTVWDQGMFYQAKNGKIVK